jgi:hypothetical protein
LLALALSSCCLSGCGDAHAPAAHPAATFDSGARDTASQAAGAQEAGPNAAANTTSDQLAVATNEQPAAAEAPTRVEVAVKKPAGRQDITFDTIKFKMDKEEEFQRSMLTPAIEALEGRTVRVRGYIFPTFQQEGLTQFVLVRDNMECCFGPGAAIYDCIVVEMKPGRDTNYTIRPVAVEVTFTLQEFRDPDGVLRAIYHLDGDAVQ